MAAASGCSEARSVLASMNANILDLMASRSREIYR